MASMGMRVGRLVPRLGARLTCAHSNAQVAVVPAHLVRMVELRVHAQQQVRSFVMSSARCLQAQVEQEKDSDSAEQSNQFNNKSQVEKELDEKLYKLDLYLRKWNRASPSELDEAIKLMRRSNSCTSTQALLMLRFCGSVCADDSKQSRRNRMSELVPTLYSIATLDVSHFNAILKVHMDNGEKVEISKFLTEMEASNVVPNRVTYNYLIGLYCMEGNITGATTVLEQMKEEGMTINESVFHSLLYGHVYNKDKESTIETLNIMESSKLLPGAETYTWMLMAAARVQDWDRVEELLLETVEKDIRLDAGDHFRLLEVLCENGMGAEAETLARKIPKRAGYFQEMRNALPQIMYAGYIDLAYQIFDDFEINSSSSYQQSDEQLKAQGIFFSRLLAIAGVEPNRGAELVLKMFDEGKTRQLVGYISSCLELKMFEHIQALKLKVDERPGNTRLFFDDVTNLVIAQGRIGMQECKDALDAVRSLGGYVNYARLARSLIEKDYDSDNIQPAALVRKIGNEMKMTNTMLNDQLITYLLEKKNLRANQDLNGFLLFTNMHNCNVGYFKNSLISNALAMGSMDTIINIIFLARRTNEHVSAEKVEIMYREILGSMKNENDRFELLKSALVELNNHKLGVPRTVADEFRNELENEEIKELLTQAVVDFETPDIWTHETESGWLEQRKYEHREACNKSGFKTPSDESRRYRGKFEMPDDLNEMYKIRNVISKREEVNFKLEDNIIKGLASANKPVEAIQQINEVRNADTNFNLSLSSINNVVHSFLRIKQPQEALDFLTKYADEHFFSTYMDIIEGFAAQGDNEKVFEMLGNLPDPDEKKSIKSDEKSYAGLFRVYEAAGDVDNLNKLLDVVQKIAPKGALRYSLGSLVKVYLNADDLKGAVEAFQKLSRKYKALPAKYALMTRLVQDENIDDLQKVIDSSIGVIGEELTLYSLTQVFLEQDRRSQAKKMLETPGLMYNLGEVNRLIHYFIREKRLDCLEDLVIMSKNVFGCDRDHLFHSWVNAEASNPDKIEEIWMQIQDEGYAPSVGLKSEIAKALKAAGRTIPFSTTDLDLEDRPAVAQSGVNEVRSESRANEARPERRLERRPVQERSKGIPSDRRGEQTLQRITLSDSEVESLVQSLKNEDLPKDELENGIKKLMRGEKLKEAADVLKHVQYSARSSTVKLIKVLGQTRQYDQLDSFINDMSPETKRAVKTNKILGDINPARILEVVKATSNDGDLRGVKCSAKLVDQVLNKVPKIREELLDMSNSGHLAATVVLARNAVYKRDTETLVRCWSLDTREDKRKVADDLLCTIHDFEHLRWVAETVNYDGEILRKALNSCFSKRQSANETKDILEYGIQHGLPVEEINTTALNMALTFDNFPHKEEIQSILKQREERKEQSSSST